MNSEKQTAPTLTDFARNRGGCVYRSDRVEERFELNRSHAFLHTPETGLSNLVPLAVLDAEPDAGSAKVHGAFCELRCSSGVHHDGHSLQRDWFLAISMPLTFPDYN
jgi:hypothetical protein